MKCPICKTAMKNAGQIAAGADGKLLDVCYCPRCGYRDICSETSDDYGWFYLIPADRVLDI